jgi:hypothetical protein
MAGEPGGQGIWVQIIEIFDAKKYYNGNFGASKVIENNVINHM